VANHEKEDYSLHTAIAFMVLGHLKHLTGWSKQAKGDFIEQSLLQFRTQERIHSCYLITDSSAFAKDVARAADRINASAEFLKVIVRPHAKPVYTHMDLRPTIIRRRQLYLEGLIYFGELGSQGITSNQIKTWYDAGKMVYIFP